MFCTAQRMWGVQARMSAAIIRSDFSLVGKRYHATPASFQHKNKLILNASDGNRTEPVWIRIALALISSNAIRIHTGSVRLPSCHRRTTAEVDVQIIGLYDKPN